MTQENRELLLKDLCARLPYGVKVKDDMNRTYHLTIGNIYLIDLFHDNGDYVDTPIKPYLRPMSSMTEEENVEYEEVQGFDNVFWTSHTCETDWLNEHHFDYRGLIGRGLAIEVNEENNPYK